MKTEVNFNGQKIVTELAPPVPVEILRFGALRTLELLSPAQPRGVPDSPDSGLIADYLGPVRDARALAARLSATPGVVEHGLFEPELVSLVLIGSEQGVERRTGAKRDA